MQPVGTSASGFVYCDTGGDGPAVVLLHGVLMNGTLWDDVVDRLRGRYRCIVPELPFGAHRTPMREDADLTLESIAKMIAGFIAELDLRDVTLVCNDWGGAQLVISPGGSDRVANLVLVSCEAFDNYPPGLPGRLLCHLHDVAAQRRGSSVHGHAGISTSTSAPVLAPWWCGHDVAALAPLAPARIRGTCRSPSAACRRSGCRTISS